MHNNEELYKFIYPNSDDKLSTFSKSDLHKLFDLIDSSHLGLRDRLGIDKFVTFGMEIESEYAKNGAHEKIKNASTKNHWEACWDLSLKSGVEAVSPIMIDEVDTWKDVSVICSILKENSKIDRNAGAHVHVGSQILGDDLQSWVNFIRFWGVYENIIFRFASGEYLTYRPHTKRYAEPVAEYFLERYSKLNLKEKTLYFLLHAFDCQEEREYAINFTNVVCSNPKTLMDRNTIEFRCPNGTLNPTIWQNNVNFFVKMLNYSKSSKYDSDTIDRRYKLVKRKKLKLDDYNKIYLNQMLELCDLVFDNNLDKIYFLKQYLKSFEVYNGTDDYIKTRRRIFME